MFRDRGSKKFSMVTWSSQIRPQPSTKHISFLFSLTKSNRKNRLSSLETAWSHAEITCEVTGRLGYNFEIPKIFELQSRQDNCRVLSSDRKSSFANSLDTKCVSKSQMKIKRATMEVQRILSKDTKGWSPFTKFFRSFFFGCNLNLILLFGEFLF